MDSLEKILSELSVNESYEIAKGMEQYKTNPVLGYRTAGSEAEFKTGEMIYETMKKIGLEDVTKDKIKVDSWEFKRARMKFSKEADAKIYELGGYQTDFETDGFQEYEVVYLKKGTKNDYEGIDVTDKLVLVDINQRDEWWINYPVYQAYLKGAAALIAVQEGGYGEINSKALNAQDIAGPCYAPAFSMSQADAAELKRACKNKKSVKVYFDAYSEVVRNQTSYNIAGYLKGKSEQMLMVSAHYDSYFDGFQDDNAAVAMMLSIAKAFVNAGYQPEKTIVFCAMAAEEWGMENTKYDWSTGAYQQVFHVHKDWAGKMFADFNFELPALAHGKSDGICCVYEYRDYLKSSLKNFPVPKEYYPEGFSIIAPVKTWSDDFSIAIAGIPSMVNDFSDSRYMETLYHSQFDTEKFYEEKVYEHHHRLYTTLIYEFDRMNLPPLNFAPLFSKLAISKKKAEKLGFHGMITKFNNSLRAASDFSQKLYRRILKYNTKQGTDIEFTKRLAAELLHVFKIGQDAFVRLNWHDEVSFAHDIIIANLRYTDEAIAKLSEKDVKAAMTKIYHIDNNRYAFLFDKEVFSYFTSYVLNQPEARLLWGANRIVGHENLYDVIDSLKRKASSKSSHSYEEERRKLASVRKHQQTILKQIFEEENRQVIEMTKEIKSICLDLDANEKLCMKHL